MGWSIGFGLERLGLAAIRAPKVALAIVILFSAFCAAGIPSLRTDSTLSELFRAGNQDYRNYADLSERFPTAEFDVLVVIDGEPDLMTPEKLEAVRTMHLDLGFADGVNGILSIFSMRDPPDESGVPPPMLPVEWPTGADFDALMKRVLDHPLVGGKLFSTPDDGSQLTLLVLSLDREKIREEGVSGTVQGIEDIVKPIARQAGLSVKLAGAPVMQREIRDAIARDRLIYNSAGFVVGLSLCFFFFRRWSFIAITSVCPAIAVLWALGILGHLQLELNTFINVIPPLMLVIAYTNAMHMVFSIRRGLNDGLSREDACRRAILAVGPACCLTSLTTATAFASLMITDSALISTFGIAASIATMSAFFAVIAIVPVLTLILIRDERIFLEGEKTKLKGIQVLDRIAASAARVVQTYYAPIALGGVLLVGLALGFHLQLEPKYRLSDQVPTSKQALAATDQIDQKLTGAIPINIMIQWPDGENVVAPDVLATITEAHEVPEQQPGVGNVWSVETLRRWLRDVMSDTNPESVRSYIEQLPPHVVGRFVNETANSTVITGRLNNMEAEQTAQLVETLEAKLDAVRARHPGFEVTVSGLSVVAAQQASNMIRQLSTNLLATILIVIALIGLAFRSLKAASLSVIPNIFPITAAGTMLFLAGWGLEYASIIGLIVAFGLAVDNTIHFLNRLMIEEDKSAKLESSVYQTIAKLGPVLILTTMVMVVGIGVTVFSDLPQMRLFGSMMMVTLSAALTADLFILPAIILTLRRFISSGEQPVGRTT